jgi:hypothetical protein
MKKIYIIITLVLLVFVTSCTGYKPIFSSKNLNFKLSDFSLGGDKKISNKIYSKLYNLSRSSKNDLGALSISVEINSEKEKVSTAKDKAGKVLEYKITLNTDIEVRDFNTNKKILDQIFTSSSSYRVQSQYSETVKLENKLLNSLVNKNYQDLLIKLSQNIIR